jgi:hypothetical protein
VISRPVIVVSRVPLLAALVMALTFGLAASAQAASLSASVQTPDPVEERAVSVDLSGTTESDRSVYAYVEPGASSTNNTCSSTAYSESTKYNATQITNYGGDPAATGTFSINHDYTPNTAGLYRVCAYLANNSSVTAAAVSSVTFQVRAATGSVALTLQTPDPAEESPFSITASGQTENDRTLFVYVETGTASPCAATAYSESTRYNATQLTSYGGESLYAGQFAKSVSYTPANPGSEQVCAYVARNSSDAPTATATLNVSPRRANASVGFSWSADPREARDVSVTTSGSTERARSVFAYAQAPADGSSCAATAYSESTKYSATLLSRSLGDEAGAGSFSQTHAFKPAGAGTYQLCGYVAENSSATPNATSAATLAVRGIAASVNLAASPAYVGSPTSVSITGSTEEARKLWVIVSESTCPSRISSSGYRPAIDGQALAPGAFAVSVIVPASGAAPRTVCAYVAPDDSGAQTATGSLVITPTASPELVAILTGPTNRARVRNLRPAFSWKAGPGTDTLLVYDAEPQATSSAMATVPTATDAKATDGTAKYTGGAWAATLDDALAPGEYWWRVLREDKANGLKIYSAVSRVIVDPPPLAALRVIRHIKNGHLLRTPGVTTLLIKAAPFSSAIFTAGRAVRACTASACKLTKRIAFATASQRTLTFRWSCAQAGTWHYTVTAKDKYGTAKTATGSWRVSPSRCASLRAAEARKKAAARRKAAEKRRKTAEKRRREQQQAASDNGNNDGSSDTSSGGGCDGDPNATPYPTPEHHIDGDHDGCYGES